MSLILYKPSRQDVGETTVQIEYETDFNFPDTTYQINYYGTISGKTIRTTVYGNNNIDGTVDIGGLRSGIEETIYGDMSCNYYYTSRTYIPPTETTEGYYQTNYHEGSKSSNTVSVSFFTHPGSFDMEASSSSNSSNNIIANVLTADRINNEWIPRFKKVYHWYNQNDNNYRYINDLYVEDNEPIKAKWFNDCMKAMNSVGKNFPTNYKGPSEGDEVGDLITATAINQLNFTGIK